MAKIKITFNDDHIKLIRNLSVEQFSDSRYGFDNYCLFGGTFLYEQMALILGVADQVIPGTEESVYGPQYPDELMERFNDLDAFIVTNLPYIIDILTQFCTEGIQTGVEYWCNDMERIWHKKEEKEDKKSRKR